MIIYFSAIKFSFIWNAAGHVYVSIHIHAYVHVCTSGPLTMHWPVASSGSWRPVASVMPDRFFIWDSQHCGGGGHCSCHIHSACLFFFIWPPPHLPLPPQPPVPVWPGIQLSSAYAWTPTWSLNCDSKPTLCQMMVSLWTNQVLEVILLSIWVWFVHLQCKGLYWSADTVVNQTGREEETAKAIRTHTNKEKTNSSEHICTFPVCLHLFNVFGPTFSLWHCTLLTTSAVSPGCGGNTACFSHFFGLWSLSHLSRDQCLLLPNHSLTGGR